MKKILCIGEALIDMICTDKGQALSDGNHFLKKAGGAPTNVAAAVAALGGQVDLAAKIGADPFGDHLEDVLSRFGVGTQWLLRDENHFTTLAFVSLMQNGERDFYFNRGADGELTIEEISGIDTGQYGAVHFGSATAFLPGHLQKTYFDLLEKTKNNDAVFVSFDPNYRELLFGHQQEIFVSQSWKFLKACHFFKVSDEEALLLTRKTNLGDAVQTLLEQTGAAFAITIGKEGAILGLQGKAETIPGISIKPVDTTGAGDAFTGAVLWQLQQEENMHQIPKERWRQIISTANRAGAYTCQEYGAMEAFATLKNKLTERPQHL